MNHHRDNERASDSCYSLFESFYETHPNFRIFILKSKADGVFTRGECNDLMDMNAAQREAELQKEQDEKLKSIGETRPDAPKEITPVDLKQ
jgi:N6-adenosine-specific RNA methylase IME4